MSLEAERSKLAVEDLVARFRGEMIPLTGKFSYFSTMPIAEDDLRQALSTMERVEGPVKEIEGEAAALLANVIERRGKTTEASVLFERAAAILRPLPQRFGYGRLAAYAALADHYRATKRSVDEQHFRQLAGALTAP